MDKYIIAHDVGTSGNKAVLVDTQGQIRGKCFAPFEVHYPKACWAEQEPADWWRAIVRTTRELLAQTGVSPGQILCVTHCTQMLGIVPVSSKTGSLRRAIIWLDGRASTQAQWMMRRFIDARVFALIAGSPLCGKDCIPKLLWLKEEEPDTYRRMDYVLDVNGYLMYRSTGNMVMDWTGASVIGMDLNKKEWLRTVFRYVGLDPRKLPPLVRSTDQAGVLTAESAGELGLLQGTPVIAGAGDAPCAAVGSGAVREGAGHIYLGTSAWLGVVTSRRPKGKHGVASIHSADPNKVLLIAESETAGGCLRWAAGQVYHSRPNECGVSDVYVAMDRVVDGVPPGSHGLIFTPWMYGERAPIGDCNVRSSFLNLCGHHTREDMLRAVYEGVAFNLRWLVEVVGGDFRFPLATLRATGGGAKSGTWMQILADVSHRRVEVVRDPQEAGAVGAALVAAVGLGIYPGFGALESAVKVDRVFDPQEENFAVYDSLFDSFREAYSSLRRFYRRLNEKTMLNPGLSKEVGK
jgi:xylulokinase